MAPRLDVLLIPIKANIRGWDRVARASHLSGSASSLDAMDRAARGSGRQTRAGTASCSITIPKE